MVYYIQIISCFLVVVLGVLIAVAYYTLLDRKVLGAIQRRTGPTVVGIYGLLQPLADGLKLFLKETIIPTQAHTSLFLLAPLITFVTSMIGWLVIPFSIAGPLVNLDSALLFVLAVSSLGVLGVLFSGWGSNSKYAFLGGLRSSSQIISYEVSLGFILLSVVLLTGSTNLYEIVWQQCFGLLSWHCWFLWPQCILFLISAIAETNRAPFDLPEAEAELVAGYFLDYSALTFALFFLGEYSAILIIAILLNVFFLGGYEDPFWGVLDPICLGLKNTMFCFFWVQVRATFPRYRFDQLMDLGWKCFLPLSIALLLANASFLFTLSCFFI